MCRHSKHVSRLSLPGTPSLWHGIYLLTTASKKPVFITYEALRFFTVHILCRSHF
uniref:Rap-GAP domain-containing protein n=1 Tax=Parascaris univalens TaxID=6257 RepID=A0A915AS56_PARUN